MLHIYSLSIKTPTEYMMNIAFFQSTGLSCNVLISEPNSAVVAQSGGCTVTEIDSLLSRAGSLIQISLLFPITALNAFAATL